MSSDVLRFHGADPTSAVSAHAIERLARALREAFPRASQVSIRRWDDVRLVDCGVNLESARCPTCGHDLLGDGTFVEAASAAFGASPVDLEFRTPCCATATSLDQLTCSWPVGFSRFTVDVWDPDTSTHVFDDLLARLGPLAGCRLAVVRAHY